jgi:hypothetical protein
VRNPFVDAEAVDINSMGGHEIKEFLENETKNMHVSGLQLDNLSRVSMENVVICSDGFGWQERQLALGKLDKRIRIVGVNGSLAKWRMVGDKAEVKKSMAFYLVNNPYSECMGYLPRTHRYYPNLVASTKTFPEFVKQYGSEPFFYKATKDLNYSGASADVSLSLDDYRNPVCAAISFALKLGARRIVLFCCDESFGEDRPNAVKMKNGLYQYPTQIMCQKVIDKQLYWVRKAGIRVADCSSGIDYENAEYIDTDGLESFFAKD